MSTYPRGVTVEEKPTSLLPPVRTGTIVVAIGTAKEGPVNKAVPIFTLEEYGDTFGISGDWEKHTLEEVAQVAFALEAVSPVIFISVGNDASSISSSQVIGGIDPVTLKPSGLEVVEEIYPRFRLVPSILIAPGFSKDPAVATAMAAKAGAINGHFKAMAYVDIEVEKYTDAPAYLVDNGLKFPQIKALLGKGISGEKKYHPSTLAAFRKARIDAENSGIPSKTVSNKPLYINDSDFHLGLDQANYLAGQGVTPLFNNANGWVFWGARTAAYPSSTDPKDTFDNVRHMFNFLNNELILTFNQKVDTPITRRFIRTIVDSYQTRLNGLSAREDILGGRIAFVEEENPITDLMDGIATFHVWFTPPSPAREIHFITEYDPNYWKTLFGS